MSPVFYVVLGHTLQFLQSTFCPFHYKEIPLSAGHNSLLVWSVIMGLFYTLQHFRHKKTLVMYYLETFPTIQVSAVRDVFGICTNIQIFKKRFHGYTLLV